MDGQVQIGEQNGGQMAVLVDCIKSRTKPGGSLWGSGKFCQLVPWHTYWVVSSQVGGGHCHCSLKCLPCYGLVYPVSFQVWFTWYAFNMPMYPFILNSPWYIDRVAPCLLPGISHSSVCAVQVALDMSTLVLSHPPPQDSVKKLLENGFSWDRAGFDRPLFYTRQSNLKQHTGILLFSCCRWDGAE